MTLNQNDVYDDARKMFRISMEEIAKAPQADESSRLTVLLSCVLNAWVQERQDGSVRGAISDGDGEFHRIVSVGIGQTLGNFCLGLRPASPDGKVAGTITESLDHWIPGIASVAQQHAIRADRGQADTSIYFERTADGDIVRDILPGGQDGARN